MKVKVRRLRANGRDTLRDESAPPTVGELAVGEFRNLKLQRSVLRARLIDPTTEDGNDLLPELVDVKLLCVADNKFRLNGIEYVDNVAYGQTWSVEPAYA